MSLLVVVPMDTWASNTAQPYQQPVPCCISQDIAVVPFLVLLPLVEQSNLGVSVGGLIYSFQQAGTADARGGC